MSLFLAFALITGFVRVLPNAEAVAKPTLAASVSVNQGSATTLKVSFAAKNIVKTTWKASNANVTIYNKSKTKAVVIGNYTGSSTVSAKITYKVKNKKKTAALKCSVTVNKREPQAVTKEGQALDVTTIENARDLGGYRTTDGWRVKRNKIFRTAVWDKVSAEDQKKLKNKYGIGYDFDFRIASELEAAPEIRIDGIEYINAPIELQKYYKDPEAKELDPMYAREAIFDGEMMEQFGKVLKKMVEDRGQHGIAFHCTYGKNRTGIMAALILALLGVDQETILNDYQLTTQFTGGVLDTDPLEAMFGQIKLKYGSIENFVRDKLGFSLYDVYTLKAYYRERDVLTLKDATSRISKLDAAKNASQIIVVNGVGGSDADFGFYEKVNGKWKEVFTTYAFVGRSGFASKKQEGDGATPIGTFHFTHAFGILDDPGCTAFPYLKVTDDDYWCAESGPNYNLPVKKSEHPELDFSGKYDTEHLIDESPAYNYALNISWNEEGKDGLGSAIFMHCFQFKPFTGGCVALDEVLMKAILEMVNKDCQVVLGKNLL